jgi:hypothetical protein
MTTKNEPDILLSTLVDESSMKEILEIESFSENGKNYAAKAIEGIAYFERLSPSKVRLSEANLSSMRNATLVKTVGAHVVPSETGFRLKPVT